MGWKVEQGKVLSSLNMFFMSLSGLNDEILNKISQCFTFQVVL